MKSILIIGMGRLGRHLATKMEEMGNDVMAVDKDGELIEAISGSVTDCIIGDCTNTSVIKSLGVENFNICFVTIGDDFQSSLVITYLLKQAGARRIVAKARQAIQAELLKSIGANEVIFPEKEIAEKLAVRYNADNIFDFIPLTADFAIYEIPVLSSWVGKSILKVNVRANYNISIVAIKHGSELVTAPGADYEFRDDDHMMVIGKSTDVFKLSSKA
jgi:trk system potassium uptake protein TrkA